MRLLVTGKGMVGLGGMESVLRDLARGLTRRGHEVVVFTGDRAPARYPELNNGIRQIWRLEELPWEPDLIHAQHNMEAMTAIMGCPGTPALFFSHGAVADDTPPLHPRIQRYLTMSETLRERIIMEFNLPPENVQPFFNWVNLERFRNVRRPPERITKALFFSAQHNRQSATLVAVTEACRLCGVSLHHAGRMNFPPIDKPEEELPGYDLVFASGKSALDALACGCPVIIMGSDSCGPLISPENFARFRRANFSLPANFPPPEPRDIAAQIHAYQARENQAVTELLRTQCDLETALDHLEEIYEEVLAGFRPETISPENELAAELLYMRRFAHMLKCLERDPHATGTGRDLGMENLLRLDLEIDQLQRHLAGLG